MDPVTLTIITASSVSASAIVASVTLNFGERIAANFASIADAFYHHDVVSVSNANLWLSLLKWMQPHMDPQSPKMLIPFYQGDGEKKAESQFFIPLPGKCLKVKRVHAGCTYRVWIRTIPNVAQNKVGCAGFQVFTDRDYINEFWLVIMKEAGLVSQQTIESFEQAVRPRRTLSPSTELLQ